MTKSFYVVVIAALLVSCMENPKDTKKSPTLIPLKEVKGTFDSEIKKPTFVSIASSFKTTRIPEQDFEAITSIVIEDLTCQVEDTTFCDEFTNFFNNSLQYSFVALEEYAEIVEGRKNVFRIKGDLVSGEKKVSAILFFTVFEDWFKGNIIIETPAELTIAKQGIVTIAVKGKKSK